MTIDIFAIFEARGIDASGEDLELLIARFQNFTALAAKMDTANLALTDMGIQNVAGVMHIDE